MSLQSGCLLVPPVHTPFFCLQTPLVSLSCIHCLRMKSFRWRRSRNLLGALTGFGHVSSRTCNRRLSDMQALFVLYANVRGYFLSTTSKTSMIINQPDITQSVTSLVVCCLDLIVFYAKQDLKKCPSTKHIKLLQYFPLAQLHMHVLSVCTYLRRIQYLKCPCACTAETAVCAGETVRKQHIFQRL